MSFNVSYIYKLRDQMSPHMEKIRKTALRMTKDINRSNKAMSVSFADIGKQSKIIGKNMMMAGGAITAPLALMTREAMQFEKGVAELATLMPGKTLKGVKEEFNSMLLDISTEFGKNSEDVVKSAYQAVSAGIPASKQALEEFMKIASKASVGGVTSLETAVDGMTSIMNAFKTEGQSATEISDKMFTAVRLGKTTFEEMSQAMFQVAPTASALGIKFAEVTSAIASVTAKGVPTKIVTTQMRQLLVELSKSATPVSKVFKKISGQSFPEFIKGGGTLAQALNMIREKADKAGVNMADVFGSVEAGSIAMNLSGSNAKDYSVALEETAKSAGATDVAFNKLAESASFKYDQSIAGFKAMSITLGEQLLPMVGKVANKLGSIVGAVSSFIKENPVLAETIISLTAVLGVLITGLGLFGYISGAVIGGIVAIKAGFLALAGALGLSTASVSMFTLSVISSTAALLANPITWVVVAVVALGVAIYKIVKNWDAVKNAFVGAVIYMKEKMSAFGSFVAKVWERWKYLIMLLVPAIIPFVLIARVIRNNWGAITGVFVSLWNVLKQFGAWIASGFIAYWEDVKIVASALGGLFSGIWETIKIGASSAFDWVISKLDWLNSKIGAVFSALGFDANITATKETVAKTAVSMAGAGEMAPEIANKFNAGAVGATGTTQDGLKPQKQSVDVNVSNDVGGVLKIEIDNKGNAKATQLKQNGNLGFQVGGG